MTLLKQAMAILGTVLTIAIIVAIVSPKTAHAVAAALVQIQPGTTTHVGQNETQLVNLSCTHGMPACVTVGPDTVLGTSGYVVPAGYTLIVTDWEYTTGAYAAPAGQPVANYLSIQNHGLHDQLIESYTQADSVGAYLAHEKYGTGIRVGSGESLQDGVAQAGTGGAYVQGYLVPN